MSGAPKVGFIGLGSQGGPMARQIIDAGFRTTLWARRPESLEPFADTAARVADTPKILGADSDIVGICVRADADVVAVVSGPHGVLSGMAPDGVIMVHSTTHPDTCRRLAETAADRGVSLIDAPVSGGGQRAAERGAARDGRRRRRRAGAMPTRDRGLRRTRDPSRSGRVGPAGQAHEQPRVHRAPRARNPRLRAGARARRGTE